MPREPGGSARADGRAQTGAGRRARADRRGQTGGVGARRHCFDGSAWVEASTCQTQIFTE
jgi:hypothetical protein